MKEWRKGWSEELGSFRCLVEIDENKTDHLIRYRNGCYAKQIEAFHDAECDWNCDGDIYVMYGAYFQNFDRDGEPDGGSFWTPGYMADALVGVYEGEDHGGYTVVAIEGAKISEPRGKLAVDRVVAMTEQQKLMQDIERNKAMKRFGIDPNQPYR